MLQRRLPVAMLQNKSDRQQNMRGACARQEFRKYEKSRFVNQKKFRALRKVQKFCIERNNSGRLF